MNTYTYIHTYIVLACPNTRLLSDGNTHMAASLRPILRGEGREGGIGGKEGLEGRKEGGKMG